MTVVAHHVPQARPGIDQRRHLEAARRRREALERLAARRMPVPGRRYVEVVAAPDGQVAPVHVGPRNRHVTVVTPFDDDRSITSPAVGLSVEASELPKPALTAREVEVLRTWLMLDSKPAVAEDLYISLGTVNTHLTRIRAKYIEVGRPASTKAALVARAVQDGLVSLDEL
ncbi:response regulator transcription factor [Gordonia soli]|uniref:Putative LuxR family transcriptional regulator n=1 Tax=Gordonia soli NBRC 108243 TaxID=1223545 RepID=M0QN57_9ACTN|nr:helix-turn-helix transcriptional regulator [Gordonia soli]GAC68842.1 putative LuxR family transcriptional regulator [Gordonia soli NBRC 108243]